MMAKVHLGARAPAMKWNAAIISDISYTCVSGAKMCAVRKVC